ncbi:DUF397 domain-containing protein [Streptomyces sp. NPDC058664]
MSARCRSRPSIIAVVPVRDSKVPAGPALAVSAAFAVFVDSVKARRSGV